MLTSGSVWGGASTIGLYSSMVPGVSGLWSRFSAIRLGGAADRWIDEKSDGAAVLDRYFDSWQPFGCDAHLALALGLGGGPKSIRAAATDLLITVIEDGRVDPVQLGAQLGELTSAHYLLAGRWAPAVTEAAVASPWCAQVICEVVELAVGELDPNDLPKVLPVLDLLEGCLL